MNDVNSHFDVLIIGGGPGGLSAAFWCAEFGLRPMIFERETEVGGQLLWTFNPITNYLGIEAANGREMCDILLQHIENRNVAITFSGRVTKAGLDEKIIELSDGRSFRGRAIVIATGVRRRELNVPGEKEFRGRGLLVSGAGERDQVYGKRVVIVGGGDAAIENALILSEKATSVTVIHRGDSLSARSDFVDQVRLKPQIEILFTTKLTAIEGKESVESVSIESSANTGMGRIAADAVLIRIGIVPNSELFASQLETDERGFIVADKYCRTSIGAVFAIGDVTDRRSLTIIRAVSDGAAAAREILNLAAD